MMILNQNNEDDIFLNQDNEDDTVMDEFREKEPVHAQRHQQTAPLPSQNHSHLRSKNQLGCILIYILNK